MAINIEYAPDANLVGPVAQQAGQGMFQQRQADRQQTQNNMLLQAQLQERSQRMGFALDTARLGQQVQAQNIAQQNDLVRMNFAANLQAQQQQFQQAMAVQQQQNDLAFRQAAGAQAFELQQQMNFAELGQNAQMMQLKNSSQATQAWQQLQGEQVALKGAMDEGWITEEQYQQMAPALVQKMAGFNPSQYSLDGPYEQGQGMGDIWDETRSFPGIGDVTLKMTRDRNGVPQLTDESKLYFEKVVVPQTLQKMGIGTGKSQPGQTPEGVSFTDYATMWSKINTAMTQTDDLGNSLPVDPTQVDATLDNIYNSYQRRFGAPDPNATSPSPLMQQIMGGMIGGQQPQAQQQAPQPMQQPRGIDQQGQVDLRSMYGIPQEQMPPDRFAEFVISQNPQMAVRHIATRYNNDFKLLKASGNQDDMAIAFYLLNGGLPTAAP